MSDTTKAALDAAIEAHVADECDGAVVTGYALVVSNTTVEQLDEEVTGYLLEYPARQAFHVGLGLARRLSLQLDHEAVIEDD